MAGGKFISGFVVCAVAVVACVSLAPSVACEAPEFQAEGVVGLHFGHTLYRFEGPTGGSELIFPLDMPVGGIRGELTRRVDHAPLWSVRGEALIGLKDPGNRFSDRDWYVLPNGLNVNYSYTESSVSASFYKLDLEGAYQVYAANGVTVSLIGGVGYEKISQTANGYIGAKLVAVDDSTVTYLPTSSAKDALKYDVKYITPRIGLRPRIEFSPHVTLDLSAAGSPLVYVKDRDEHLLRYFVTNADGRGYGFFGNGSLKIHLNKGSSPSGQFIRLDGEVTVIGANLSSGIHWYGDDPIDTADNTGNSGIGIPHDIRTTQYQVSLRFGTEF